MRLIKQTNTSFYTIYRQFDQFAYNLIRNNSTLQILKILQGDIRTYIRVTKGYPRLDIYEISS